MITFSKLGYYGAIGNQLFQYATLYSAGKLNGYQIKIPNTEEHFEEGTKRIQHYFLNCFNPWYHIFVVNLIYFTINHFKSK